MLAMMPVETVGKSLEIAFLSNVASARLLHRQRGGRGQPGLQRLAVNILFR